MTETKQTIDSAHARSWLLVNPLKPHFVEAALHSRADAIILDMEDSVPHDQKDTMRKFIVDWFNTTGNQAWVRINAQETPYWNDDITHLRDIQELSGVVLAKSEHPEQIQTTHESLGGAKVIALIETAIAVENLTSIAHTAGTFRLALGLNDYQRDLGFSSDPRVLAYTRSRLTIASRAAELPGPIDGPTLGTSQGQLARDTAVTFEFGMTGKLCLQPNQCGLINEGLSPSHEDIHWACTFLEDFELAGGKIRDGSDPPQIARAHKLIELAKLFHLQMI